MQKLAAVNSRLFFRGCAGAVNSCALPISMFGDGRRCGRISVEWRPLRAVMLPTRLNLGKAIHLLALCCKLTLPWHPAVGFSRNGVALTLH